MVPCIHIFALKKRNAFTANTAEFEYRVSRSQFVAVSEPKPGNGPRKPPQAHFVAISESKPGMAPGSVQRPIFLPFPSPSQEMAPGSLQRPSFTHFRARPRKWSQEACRGPFLDISEPKPGNEPRKPAEAQFYPLPSPSQEMAPGSLQRPSFTHFRAEARKWLQEASRDPCLAISEPKQGNGPRAQFYPLPSPS